MGIHDWRRVSAGTYHDFHFAWTAELRRALNTHLLPQRYYAQAEQVAGDIVPDVLTLRQREEEESPDWLDGGGDEWDDGSGGLAVATAPPRLAVTATLDEPAAYAQRRRRIAVRHRSGDRLVAMIEIVSPGNKDRERSVDMFAAKAVDAIESGLHLLVIDPFPPGRHDPGGMHGVIWDRLGGDYAFDSTKPLTLAAYRAAELCTAYVQPMAVGDPLVDMPLFLDRDHYINIPLAPTYEAAWEGVPRRWRGVVEGG